MLDLGDIQSKSIFIENDFGYYDPTIFLTITRVHVHVLIVYHNVFLSHSHRHLKLSIKKMINNEINNGVPPESIV